MLIFTTPLYLLYPPLKGFSFDQDHVRIRDFLENTAQFKGFSSQMAFEGKFARKLHK